MVIKTGNINDLLSQDFTKWSGVLWKIIDSNPIAYCLSHRHRLDIIDQYDRAIAQDYAQLVHHKHLLCPVDNATFPINGDSFWTMQRRFKAMIESEKLKGATYRDLDNIYTPILTVAPKPKDDRFSIQVEIDETPQGKKLVIYAMDRENPSEKTQIFIDPQKDRLSFDSANDLHPNMIFSKVTAYFKDSKSATMEQEEG